MAAATQIATADRLRADFATHLSLDDVATEAARTHPKSKSAGAADHAAALLDTSIAPAFKRPACFDDLPTDTVRRIVAYDLFRRASYAEHPGRLDEPRDLEPIHRLLLINRAFATAVSELLHRFVLIRGYRGAMSWATRALTEPDVRRAARWLWPRIVGAKGGGHEALATAITLTLPRLDGLEVLDICVPVGSLRAKFFEAIGSMPALRQLSLRPCHVPGALFISNFRQMFGVSATLTTLVLDGIDVTGALTDLNLALPRLVEARFDRTPIALVTAIVAGASALRILRMVECSGAGVDAWIVVLKAGPGLVVVDSDWVLAAGHDEDDHERMGEVRLALFELENLQCLILQENCPDESWATLLSELGDEDEIELDALAILNLDEVDRVGVAALMELIESSSSLTSLAIDGDSDYTLSDIIEVRPRHAAIVLTPCSGSASGTTSTSSLAAESTL